MKEPILTICTNAAEETRAVGRKLGTILGKGDLVALTGELGAGKTCLAQGIAQGLEVPQESYVRSPSFVILNVHQGRSVLYHLDLYRIQGPAELEDLGYREIFYGEGVTVIEWAERITDLLPENHLRIRIGLQDETGRWITMGSGGEGSFERWDALCKVLSGFRSSGGSREASHVP
jgi:tRNA threonylcarbamoyladenosine biosynthesis protein TsaE